MSEPLAGRASESGLRQALSRRGRVKHGPSIRTLLLGAHAFVWLLPLLALSSLRIYDVYLLRQTEHQLIAESVVIGEVYREAWLHDQGRVQDAYRPLTPARRDLSYSAESSPFSPVEAQIDFAHPVLGPQPPSFPQATGPEGSAQRAGRSIEPLLKRAQTFNLSAVRVLDERGCVVATTRTEAGACMRSLPEIERALAGEYNAVLRERVSDEPPPRFGDIRRRGKVRVFTALPVWSDGRVIGVVRASRTGLDAPSSLWANRRGLVWLGLLSSLFVLGVSVAFSAAIGRPLTRLTRAARKVAQGESAQALEVAGRLPKEIGILQEVLFQMAAKLEQRASYVQEFASQVSHELKTPITAIRGAAELLEQGVHDMPEADRQRFLRNILEDAHGMERLVTKLLALARFENDPQRLEYTLEPAPWAAQQLARHGERVVLQLAGPPKQLAIDPEQLASVLNNLVENALRHGGMEPVRVTLGHEGGRLKIDVRDRGPGVSELNRRRLFERFFTTERERGGTGLGLAIVRAIAEARGGRVAASFDAEGSEFTAVL
jgi:signal transduction histidine kinase